MNVGQEKHEIWGTFSVRDHTHRGAFVADVIMYDRLVIPVPPSRWGDNKAAANDEWERWEQNGWDPAKQSQLLGILGNLAVQVEWNAQWHDKWEQAATNRIEGAKQIAKDLYAVTGAVLLQVVPAMAMGSVAVTPYESLDDMKRDLGITKGRLTDKDLRRGANLPGHALTAIIGREFLVPEDDPNKDDFELLRTAVRVANDADYRQARANLHRSLNRFLNSSGETDAVSIEAAIKEMQRGIDAVRRASIWNFVRNGVGHSLFVGKTAMKLAGAPLNPIMAGATAISVGDYVAKNVLAEPGTWDPRPYGALFVDAQRRLGLDAAGERATGVWERMFSRLAAD
jgi:hypothetical protein